jgi:hypothetical protein
VPQSCRCSETDLKSFNLHHFEVWLHERLRHSCQHRKIAWPKYLHPTSSTETRYPQPMPLSGLLVAHALTQTEQGSRHALRDFSHCSGCPFIMCSVQKQGICSICIVEVSDPWQKYANRGGREGKPVCRLYHVQLLTRATQTAQGCTILYPDSWQQAAHCV